VMSRQYPAFAKFYKNFVSAGQRVGVYTIGKCDDMHNGGQT